MASLAAVVGSALVPVVLLRSGFDADALTEAALAGVALAVAALPEGLATVVVLALALGGHRLAARGAIVREGAAIEALGAADVLCTDKTGTLTEGTMRLCRVVSAGGREDDMWWALRVASTSEIGVPDPIDSAILERVGDGPRPPVLARRPFDATTRCATAVVGGAGGPRVVLKGAPETVIGRCESTGDAARLLELSERWAADGERVLAVAMGSGDDLEANGLEPLGLVSFEDPLRPTARSSVERCERGGLTVVLVTGDHPATASAVARAVGIDGPVTTGAELAALPPEGRRRALLVSGVVARVEPEQKVELVEAHQAAGHIVAMTGDGINDAPALQHADVGVALAGVGGTDVAREAADVILTNGDLSVLIDAISEGRHIRWNLRSVVRYLLTGNLSEVLVVAGAIVLLPSLTTPFLPVHLLWLNLVTDGAPALALAADATTQDALAPSWPKALPTLAHGARLRTLAPRAIAVAAAALGAGVLALRWGWEEDLVRSQLLLSLIVGHLLLAFNARSRVHTLERGWARSPVLLGAVGGSLAIQGLVFGTEAGRSALGLATLPAVGWVLAATSATVAIGAIDLARLLRHSGPGGSVG
jgi:Ca2+-transporting ATPase